MLSCSARAVPPDTRAPSARPSSAEAPPIPLIHSSRGAGSRPSSGELHPPAPPSHGHDDAAEPQDPFDVLLGSIDAVIAEWRALVRPEPWAELPPSRLLDSLPEIIPALVRQARVGAVHVDDELRERIADEHGAARREDALPVAAVAEEWTHLKRACWQVLARHGFVNGSAAEAMRRIDVLVDDAVGYTLRGYYRDELDTLRGRGLERREGSGDRRASQGDRRDDGG